MMWTGAKLIVGQHPLNCFRNLRRGGRTRWGQSDLGDIVWRKATIRTRTPGLRILAERAKAMP
jgi:hypothetical protein